MYSDTPEFDGNFERETSGTYQLEESRVTLVDFESGESAEMYLVKIRNDFYLVTKDTYSQWSQNDSVIVDLGLKQRRDDFQPKSKACKQL